jgi:hypothetical protein
MRVLDASAIGLSGLCLVHCLAFPVVVALLPTLGALTRGEGVHWVFLALAVPVSIVAVALAFRRGRTPLWLVGAALAGLGLLFLGVLQVFGSASETPLTTAGALMLATAHIVNWRVHMRGHAHRHLGA